MAKATVTYDKMLGGKGTTEVEYEPTGKWSADVEQIKEKADIPFGATIYKIEN